MSEGGKDNLQLEDKIKEVAAEIYDDLSERNVHPLNNPKIYEFIGELPAEQRDKLLLRHERRRDEYKRFKQELGENLTSSIFHPGVDTRQKEFVAFAKQQKNKNPQISPFDLVQGFSNSLGNLQIYRGMALKEADLSTIERVGVLAPAMLSKETGIKSLSRLLSPNLSGLTWNSKYPSTFVDDAISRINDMGVEITNTISSSTSAYREVASSVGWHSSGNTNREGFVPYTLTLQVPKILCYQEEDIARDFRGPRKVKVGDITFGRKGLEIFVPFVILPEYIKKVEQTEIPPQWSEIR